MFLWYEDIDINRIYIYIYISNLGINIIKRVIFKSQEFDKMDINGYCFCLVKRPRGAGGFFQTLSGRNFFYAMFKWSMTLSCDREQILREN